MTPRTVLITGCSTGIGRACAERLARGGHTVYATARRLESIEDLQAAGCRTLALDVTDEGSMKAAVEAVEAEHGAIGALVNNAGYSQSGAVESLSMEDLRRQFETNVFGLVRMCQLVLPGMRRAGRGRIVNLSSMGGNFTFDFLLDPRSGGNEQVPDPESAGWARGRTRHSLSDSCRTLSDRARRVDPRQSRRGQSTAVTDL